MSSDDEFDEFSRSEENTERDVVDELECQLIQNGPIQYQELQNMLNKADPILQRLIHYMHNGWPSRLRDKLLRLVNNSCMLRDGCVLKHAEATCIVVLSAIRLQLLKQLHCAHVGADRIRAMVWQYFWWPGLDKDIKEMVQHCQPCALHQRSSLTVALHPWEFPDHPWIRLHVDFAGPFQNKMWLLAVDAHSNWPELHQVSVGSTSACRTISCLRELFARFGVPKQVVTDNGLQFVFAEFKQFCKQQSILHTLFLPYHPKSNGQVERFVQII